jgi:hypothetical protein
VTREPLSEARRNPWFKLKTPFRYWEGEVLSEFDPVYPTEYSVPGSSEADSPVEPATDRTHWNCGGSLRDYWTPDTLSFRYDNEAIITRNEPDLLAECDRCGIVAPFWPVDPDGALIETVMTSRARPVTDTPEDEQLDSFARIIARRLNRIVAVLDRA